MLTKKTQNTVINSQIVKKTIKSGQLAVFWSIYSMFFDDVFYYQFNAILTKNLDKLYNYSNKEDWTDTFFIIKGVFYFKNLTFS